MNLWWYEIEWNSYFQRLTLTPGWLVLTAPWITWGPARTIRGASCPPRTCCDWITLVGWLGLIVIICIPACRGRVTCGAAPVVGTAAITSQENYFSWKIWIKSLWDPVVITFWCLFFQTVYFTVQSLSVLIQNSLADLIISLSN